MSAHPARHSSGRWVTRCALRSGFGFTGPLAATIALAGEIDIANCEHIPVDVEALCRSGISYVRIDLTAVSFIDCMAVHAFVEARDRAEALGCDAVLTGVHGLPLRVLQMLELDADLIQPEHFSG
jgi:anti-anti-sigma factor